MKQVIVDGVWHVAVMTSDGEGAMLLRVGCWAEDDNVPSVPVPYVANHDEQSTYWLAPANKVFGNRVLGLVEPGKETDFQFWDDLARSTTKAKQDEADREDAKKTAIDELAGYPIRVRDAVVLLRKNFTSRDAHKAIDVETIVLCAELGLIVPHDSHTPWVLTMLGFAVADLLIEKNTK